MESFTDLMKEVQLPAEEIDYITSNPEGLTKEGCEYSLKMWKEHSRNRYIAKKYETMLKKCVNFTTSGKTTDGRTVLTRDDKGKPVWVEKID